MSLRSLFFLFPQEMPSTSFITAERETRQVVQLRREKEGYPTFDHELGYLECRDPMLSFFSRSGHARGIVLQEPHSN